MPTSVVRRGFAIALIAAASLASARGDSKPVKVASVEGITEYRFDNGLRLLLFPDPSAARVTVNMTVMVGSRHEGYGETGMAHLLEHMVFKGTPSMKDIPQAMKERGASWNGSTSFDRTNYFETLPASDDNLNFALKMESDRLVNSFVKGEDLKTEMTVVRNEFESGENSPQRVLGQRMMANAYEWHNYGKDTIGNRSDIERVPIANLQAFYRKYYQPDNVVVVIGGKFDESKALEMVAKTFGAIPKPSRKLDPAYTEEPPQDGERVVTLRRVGDVPVVGVLYHVPSGIDPEHAAVRVLASVLSAQPSGRLYKALVEPKKAASVRASAQSTYDPGVIEITAEGTNSTPIEQVRDAIISIVEGMKDHPPTAEEVERAKRQILKNRELAASDTNRVAVSLSEAIALGDWRFYFLDRDRVEAVTPEQVQEVARKYLKASNRTVGMFLPSETPQRTPVPARPDMAKMVDDYKGRAVNSSGESFDPTPAGIEARVQRPQPIDGVKVVLMPLKTRGEMVYLQLTLRYGDAENLKGMNEAAGFLTQLMQRGTKHLTHQQIEDALDKNMARLGGGMGGGGRGRRGGGGGGGGLGTATFSIQVKRENLAPVLDILRQILREPTLSADEFEVMKQARISQAEANRSEPQAIAANKLQRHLSSYPKDDVRYVPTIDESIERLKAANIGQVRKLYEEYLGAGHGELAIVGDFEPSEVLPLVAKMLDGWKASQPYARIERPMTEGSGAVRETILTPDKANAIYLAGIVMPVRDDDPDYPALEAANFILGGGALSSRLGNRLRQKEGWSYGAGSNFSADAQDARATLMMNAICNPQNLAKVVKGVDEELQRLLTDGITAEELEHAKAGYLQAAKGRRANEQAMAGTLANHLHLGRTMRHEADLEKAIERLTPDQVMAAVRRHIDPKKITVIGAGDVK